MPTTRQQAAQQRTKKRIILCCDGTWFDGDNGYSKPTWDHPHGILQVASNVTRISRCFKRRCSDGTLQIINYQSGVGTGSNLLDSITGGVFGLGLTERVREAYAFLCANYAEGDEIVLIGWSRGAFTVRSVAGIISNIGLLTREGVESFVPIFKDMQHWDDFIYNDPFPTIPFTNKPKGSQAAKEYRERLKQLGLTRVEQSNGELIKVKAIGVWDTVGSLGIPRFGWLDRLAKTFKWHDTDLSDCIEHAFQALALDESRSPYSPAVWERCPQNKSTTDLRQVWFPGTHGNCGGGAQDMGLANITLAWMVDQLASVGVEFYPPSAVRLIAHQIHYYKSQAEELASNRHRLQAQWAVDQVYQPNAPIRPWGLGLMQMPWSFIDWITGYTARTPGLYRQTDPVTGDDHHGPFLRDTNERIHSSVRVRLACRALGLNDKEPWNVPSLDKWQLRRTSTFYDDPVPLDPSWDPVNHELVSQTMNTDKVGEYGRYSNTKEGERWIWVYVGPDDVAPTDEKQRTMVEEPLGPYERYLLNQVGGAPNVYVFAESEDVRNEPAVGRGRKRSRYDAV